MRRALLTVACVVLAALGGATPTRAAFDDPITHYIPQGPAALANPCGVALNAKGEFYLADYYHRAVDLFTPTPTLLSRPLVASGATNPHSGPVDDPCGLALDSTGTLYVNNYHRNVVRFPAPLSLGSGVVLDAGDPVDIFSNPTGVATDPATNNVYVNDRTYIAAYNSAGAPLATPRIGEGSLGDSYGIAVSAYPATAGYIYAPDAATETVKVFDPATDTLNPVQSIIGPPSGFGSLKDSAVAIDNTSGEIYVIDTLGLQFVEKPQASVYVFTPAGTYKGRLKHNVIDGAPSGLAVDNSATLTKGRVYVTSGNSEHASVYIYPPGAATNAALPPLGLAALPVIPAEGATPIAATKGAPEAAFGAEAQATSSQVTQEGNLRLALAGKLSPRRLPRKGTAPISVSVGGQVSTTDGSPPPQLKTITVQINRNGHFDATGLALCPLARIQPASSSRALANCRSALVGQGSFTALAGFGESESGQRETYETQGRLLLFNGQKQGKPVLYGQIYSSRPFATSFVIPFTVKDIAKGRFGTELRATLPAALRSWGNLTGIEMTLSRRYAYQGQSHSYISAGCPAPKGFGGAVFPFVRSTFAFEGGQSISSTLTDQCKVRG